MLIKHGVLISLALGALCALFASGTPAQARGPLIKGSEPAVYYVAEDGKRYVFPNEHIYFSWYADFSEVQTVTDADLATYALGGNITYRPGTRLMKLASDPRVYAIEPGGIMRWIPTEDIAKTLYGDAWASRVDDLPDAFFPAYAYGEELAAGEYPNGMLLHDATNDRYFVMSNGQARLITDEALVLNGWQTSFALEGNLSAFTSGADVTDEETAFSDTAELGLGTRQTTAVIGTLTESPSTIVQGETAQTLGAFRLSFADETTVQNPRVVITSLGNTDNDFDAGGLVRGDETSQIEANLKGITIVDESGSALFGPAELSTSEDNDHEQTLILSGTHTFTSGSHLLTIVANLSEDAPEGETYDVTWELNQTAFTVDGTTTTDITPDELESEQTEVVAGGLTIDLQDGVESETIVGSTGGTHTANTFLLANSLHTPVTIQSLTVTGYVDENEGDSDFQPGADADEGSTTFFSSIVSSVSLVRTDDGSVVDTTSTIGSDGSIRFSDINVSIGADETVSVDVTVAISPNTPFEFGADRIAVDIAEADDIDMDGDVDVFGAGANGLASPEIILTIAESGTMTITSAADGETTMVMGSEENSVYVLTMEADETEDIVIDALTVRLLDTTSARSVASVELHYPRDGQDVVASAPVHVASASFSNLDLPIPRDDGGDQSVDVYVYVNVASSTTGAVSGDEIGVAFDHGNFAAHGVLSGYAFTDDDFDDRITDETTPSGSASVVKNRPIVALSSDTIEPAAGKSDATDALRFTLHAEGEGTTKIHTMTFKVEPSDVGTEVGDNPTDNDLLERWADADGDTQDDNDIADLVDEGSGDTIAEGSDGDIDFLIYDNSERVRDATPAGLDTEGGDYGVIVYTFSSPLLIGTTPHTYTLRLDTDAFASGTQTFNVTLLGDTDFVWGDGSLLADHNDGDGVTGLPLGGPTVEVD